MWPNYRSGVNFAQELNRGGGGMPKRQPGVQTGQLCGFLQLPSFCLQLDLTEEPGEAPDPGSGTPY